MQNNLKPIIDSHYREIEEKVLKLGWDHVDENTFTSDDDASLQFRNPTILWHQNDRGEYGCYIWYRLSIGDDKYSEDVLKTALKNILNIIKLKPFIDEDAGGKFFVEKHENFPGYIEVYCYISPDFPDGWWENHTLPEDR